MRDGDEAVIAYGNFLQNVVQFFVIACVIFAVIKAMNRLNRRRDAKKAKKEAKEKSAAILREAEAKAQKLLIETNGLTAKEKELALKKQDVKNMVMHDWYLTVLCLATGKIGFVDEPLILYRQHGNNQVGAKNTKSFSYILNKALQLKKNKESIKNTYLQAKDIFDNFNDNTKNFKLIQAYADNLNKNKIQRIFSAFKFGFWKNTFLRKLGQIFFM